MPLKFWCEAFSTAVYLINRTPSKVLGFSTPLERLTGASPDYSSLRVFGCACWPNLRPYNTHKLSFRSTQCTFLGYSDHHKGYKCLDVKTGRVYISRDVTFDELVFPFSKLHPNAGALLRAKVLLLHPSLHPMESGPDSIANATNPLRQCFPEQGDAASSNNTAPALVRPILHQITDVTDDPAALSRAAPASTSNLPTGLDTGSHLVGSGAESIQPNPASPAPPGPDSVHAPHPAVGAAVESDAPAQSPLHGTSLVVPDVPAVPAPPSPAPSPPPPGPRTPLQSGIRRPKLRTDGTVPFGLSCTTELPTNFRQAILDPHWKTAMDEEYSALMKNNTWHLMLPPKGSNIIDCKWVYRVKHKPDGSIDRYKARLVAKGFKQRYGLVWSGLRGYI